MESVVLLSEERKAAGQEMNVAMSQWTVTMNEGNECHNLDFSSLWKKKKNLV